MHSLLIVKRSDGVFLRLDKHLVV